MIQWEYLQMEIQREYSKSRLQNNLEVYERTPQSNFTTKEINQIVC
jgi:hypothetical protein